jgi:hypothetical protein
MKIRLDATDENKESKIEGRNEEMEAGRKETMSIWKMIWQERCGASTHTVRCRGEESQVSKTKDCNPGR